MTESFYQLISRVEINPPAPLDNEIRIRTSGSFQRYVSIITKVLNGESHDIPNHDTVYVSGIGLSIPKLVSVTERVRDLMPQVYSLIEVRQVLVKEKFDPKLKGLKRIERERFLPNLMVKLSLKPFAKLSVGFNLPKEVESEDFLGSRERRGERTERREIRERGERMGRFNRDERMERGGRAFRERRGERIRREEDFESSESSQIESEEERKFGRGAREAKFRPQSSQFGNSASNARFYREREREIDFKGRRFERRRKERSSSPENFSSEVENEEKGFVGNSEPRNFRARRGAFRGQMRGGRIGRREDFNRNRVWRNEEGESGEGERFGGRGGKGRMGGFEERRGRRGREESYYSD